MSLALTCAALELRLRGTVEAEPLWSAIAEHGDRVQLLHAKRDGQVCFAYLDALTGLPAGGRTSGAPGEVFLFGGDPSGPRDERRGQMLLVYGPDNFFIGPLDRGGRPREYLPVGAFDDVDAVVALGEHIWRRGAQDVRLELHPT